MYEDNDDNENCSQYLHKILDVLHITMTNSPREGVGTGQAEPAVGVGSQALPTPTDVYVKYSGELGGSSDGGAKYNTN